MKYLLGTLALIAAIAATTCLLAFHLGTDPDVKAAVSKRDTMEWLRADFQLTDAQFAKIKQLHDSYSVVCEKHCMDIMDAVRARDELKKTSASATAVAAANKRVEELRAVCETAIAGHVRQCAAQMSAQAGQRYLALVLPKIADFDHQAAPDLQLTKQHDHR
jgi:hypothetical protein